MMTSTENASFIILNMTIPQMEEALTHTQGDLVTIEEHFVLLRCQFAFRTLICLGGMIGNVVNVITFLKMGLEDSVTIAFFNLAISDFFVLATTLTSTVGTLCQILQRDLGMYFHFDPYYVMIIIVTFGRTFLYSTALITTFLAIQRCLCVVRPLHFKGVFTIQRSYVVMVVIWFYCLTCGLVFVAQYDIQEGWALETNSSILFVALRPTRRIVLTYIEIANHFILNMSCVFFVFLCVLVMAHVLRKSVQFRQTATNATDKNRHRSTEEADGTKTKAKAKAKDDDPAAQPSASKIGISSSKERQVIIQVSIVSVIFLISNTPAVMMSLASNVLKDFELYTRLHYTFWTCFEVRLTVECINSAVNFLVYFKYNSKFREACFKSRRSRQAT